VSTPREGEEKKVLVKREKNSLPGRKRERRTPPKGKKGGGCLLRGEGERKKEAIPEGVLGTFKS